MAPKILQNPLFHFMSRAQKPLDWLAELAMGLWKASKKKKITKTKPNTNNKTTKQNKLFLKKYQP